MQPKRTTKYKYIQAFAREIGLSRRGATKALDRNDERYCQLYRDYVKLVTEAKQQSVKRAASAKQQAQKLTAVLSA